jgi:photosystem II stability/assembly factor-like uncharacterized protein
MHRRGSRNRFGRLSTRLRLAVLAGGLGAIALSCANEPAEAQSSAAATTSADRSEDLKSSTSPTLTPQQSGTTNRLQAISPVNARVVWASGVGGTFALTTDGGATWHSRVVPGAETLQFRDVQGISERVAYLLSSGVGTDSRIYKTEDGGDTWTLQFENQDPNGFYDCFSFWTPRRGITMADSVNGRFPVILTRNGKTWQDIGDQLPAAQAGEAAFAASGTCIATQGGKRAWIATGAATKARILATTNGGKTWAAYDTPIIQGTASSGGISVAFRDPHHGILGGGELAAPTEFSDNFARSGDGGKTWQLGARTPFPGSIYGLSYAIGRSAHGDGDDGEDDEQGEDEGHGHDHDGVLVVATGPSGASWSSDEGQSWTLLPEVTNYWAVAFGDHRTGWLVGTAGRILKISF